MRDQENLDYDKTDGIENKRRCNEDEKGERR